MIEFTCTYEDKYDNISVEDVSIVGNNVDTYAVNDGKFKFSISQFTDADLSNAVDSETEIKLGSDLFFLLSMEKPISDLTYSITGSYKLTILFQTVLRLSCL